MMKNHTSAPFVVAVVFCVLMSTASAQSNKIDIFQIVDAFIASSIAHKKCGVSDEKLERKFLTNIMAVSIAAAQKLKETSPTLPEKELTEKYKNHQHQVALTVEQQLSKNGCDSDYAKKLIRLYEFHANWDVFKHQSSPTFPK